MFAVRLRRFTSFWLYPILAALLVWITSRLPSEASGVTYSWLILAGCILWSLIEYGLHRFVFHWLPVNLRLRALVAGFHLAHHARPRDPDRILARPWSTLPLSVLLLALIYASTGDVRTTVGLTIGVWTGFLYYEWIHYRVHTSASDLGLYGHRRRHFHHHFVNEKRGFGVTSPWWDLVFGTAPKS